MVKELMHDPIFLAGKSEVATKEDLQVAQDLLDTLMAHKESCVGMAANMIGGILGGTYWGWMYVDILWVHENHRYKGIGSKLLREAEKEAVRRGCHHVHLDTMSWQAPEFYQKHGYEVIGILPDIPNGNQKYLLMKALR